MDIAAKILKLRKEKNFSTTKLAKLAGIAQSTLREIELRNTSPTWDTITKLCIALKISPLYLLTDQTLEKQELAKIPLEIDVMEKIKKLSPHKLKILNDVLDTWIDSDL